LDFDGLRVEERLLHVWRWLVDAESNLRSSRRQLDKLRDLRSEEIEVRKTHYQTCPCSVLKLECQRNVKEHLQSTVILCTSC
jgi:hypothetical protein